MTDKTSCRRVSPSTVLSEHPQTPRVQLEYITTLRDDFVKQKRRCRLTAKRNWMFQLQYGNVVGVIESAVLRVHKSTFDRDVHRLRAVVDVRIQVQLAQTNGDPENGKKIWITTSGNTLRNDRRKNVNEPPAREFLLQFSVGTVVFQAMRGRHHVSVCYQRAAAPP